MEDQELLRIVEALLFVSDDPLTTQRIADILGCEKRDATRLVRALADKYDSNGRAVSVREVAGGYQLRTKEDLAPWIRKFLATRPVRLSRAALEVLAVVAYRQPVTRQEIESIRGVDCSAVLQNLLERKLVKMMGRKDVPGRPIIYGTSRQFMEHFNLASLAELPTLKEFAEPPGGHARPEGAEPGEGEDVREGEAPAEPGSGASVAPAEPKNEDSFPRGASASTEAETDADEEEYAVDEVEAEQDEFEEAGDSEEEVDDEEDDRY